MDKWIVLAAWAARLFFYHGCMKANGVLLDDMVAYIGTTHSMVAWAFAIQSGLAFLCAPVGSALLKVFTKRQLAASGGFLVGFSYICYGLWVVSLWQLFVVYIASGLGFGLVTLPGYLNMQEHFGTKFPFMLSTSALFEYIGLATLPPVLQYLEDAFGKKDSLIIFGAILWNMVAVGIAQKPVKRKALRKGVTVESTDKNTDCPKLQQRQDEVKKATIVGFIEKHIFPFPTIFFHDNIMIFMVIESLMLYIYISWALFLVSLGTSSGLTAEQSVFLSTCGGIGGFLGKVVAIVLFHLDKMDAYTSCLIPFTLNGLCLFGCTFTGHFTFLAVLTFVSGLCQAVSSSGMFGLLPSMVCNHHFEQAAVMAYFLDGIVLQLGGFMSGFIREKLGSTFYVFGFDSLLCLVAVPLVLRWACTSQPKGTKQSP
ncbi:Monocarboxylate transporter 2 [Holothuria leucospilota]|uniref:Monocarboxylate transporter 2 n=1 Tax=Holothuria leucospilota TaxID=206669 RepID=A0A9Q1CAY3_HOLLE|nr:Monocarboxylate transporter 2 [Holothuria leucospilota]